MPGRRTRVRFRIAADDATRAEDRRLIDRRIHFHGGVHWQHRLSPTIGYSADALRRRVLEGPGETRPGLREAAAQRAAGGRPTSRAGGVPRRPSAAAAPPGT